MRMHLSSWSVILLMLGTVPASVCQRAMALSETVWQIGKFDHSSDEFVQEVEGAPFSGFDVIDSHTSVNFIVGRSIPEKDWPAFQPGSCNRKTGHRPHAYAIQFTLPHVPQGLYTLKVGLVGVGGLVSTLQIDINGHEARAYFQHHPWQGAPADQRWTEVLEIEVPTSTLKQGANELILTAVDDPESLDDPGETGITYDAIELDHDSSQNFVPGKVAIQVEPTVYYQQKAGQLIELVEVFVRHNSASRRAQVALNVNGQAFSRELVFKHDFGEERIEFALPEFAPGTKAAISVRIGSKSHRFAVSLTPERKWTLLLVPHVHLDIGFTDYQGKVAEVQSRVLDEAIQMIHEHPNFTYSPDGFWAIQQFLSERNDEDQQRLFQMVRDHKISVPAQYACLLTAFPGVETLIRSLYPSFKFARKNGADFDYANITDVPSYSWSYASVMAAAGLKFFLAGSNGTRGPILSLGDLQQRSPFWWEGPDEGKVLMWYPGGNMHIGGVFGMPPQVAVGRTSLPFYLQSSSSSERKTNTVLFYGAQGENSDLFPQQASIVDEWNKIYAYPKLAYSDFPGALRKIADQLGNSLPVVRGDGGPYWEDGIYSDTHHAILARETEQRAPSAEKLSTISSLVHPFVRPALASLGQLWQNMILFDEHTWGAWSSVSNPQSEGTLRQLTVKDSYAIQAAQELSYVLERAMAAISDYINNPKGTLVIFNPLNWQRSGLVELDLEKGLELVDQVTGAVVPYQVLSEQPSYLPGQPPFERIRFLAQDVPAMGYKCYSKRRVQSKATKLPSNVGAFLENDHYRVALDPESGAVKSIFDKELGKELVDDSSPYRFDQYLYVTGGDQPPHNRLTYSYSGLPVPELKVNKAHDGRLVSIERTPFGTVAHLVSSDVNTPQVETDVILFDSQKKIEFFNRVRKTRVYTKEAVYFAFPVAMDHPQFRYDIQNGVIDPARDLLPGAAKEWFSCQHWVAAQQEGITVTLVPVDAELFALGDVVRGTWPVQLGERRGTILSYVMNNYWFTNYVAGQGGDFEFRYVLSSGKNLPLPHLSRLGWEEMTPLEPHEIIETDKEFSPPRPLNAAEASFLKVSQPNLVLVNWKMAEDGNGTILRFLEVGGESGQVSAQIPVLDVEAAWMCTAMEENQQPLPTASHEFSFSVKPFQIITIRVEGKTAIH